LRKRLARLRLRDRAGGLLTGSIGRLDDVRNRFGIGLIAA
jgi:hypothetical protein